MISFVVGFLFLHLDSPQYLAQLMYSSTSKYMPRVSENVIIKRRETMWTKRYSEIKVGLVCGEMIFTN